MVVEMVNVIVVIVNDWMNEKLLRDTDSFDRYGAPVTITTQQRRNNHTELTINPLTALNCMRKEVVWIGLWMNDCCQFVCYAYGSLIGRLCIFGKSSEEEIVAMETILVKRLPHQRFALGECDAWIKKDVAQNQIQEFVE
ncbi:hypothetical protein T06_10447 [Trichinella sp. T6]|nr:hypothetical protein T06_10447 [Trichinella sp. T6]